MISRRAIQVVAGVTAAVGLLVSVLFGGHDSASTALKVYSYGTSISVLLVLAYEHYIWHWPLVRKVTGRPDLRGTWKGELQSSYAASGAAVAPIPTILRIKQTASSQHATLFTGESSSVTEQSDLVREPDGRWRLTWIYANTPRTSVRQRSDCHVGTAEVTYDNVDGLVGSYFTDRLTRGELKLPVRSQRLFSSVAAAEADAGSFR